MALSLINLDVHTKHGIWFASGCIRDVAIENALKMGRFHVVKTDNGFTISIPLDEVKCLDAFVKERG